MLGILLALVLIPQVMGDEAQHGRLLSRPDERRIRRGARPRLEIGEIARQCPQRVRPRSGFGEMLQRVNLGRRQRLGQAVSRRHRQESGQCVDLKFSVCGHGAAPTP